MKKAQKTAVAILCAVLTGQIVWGDVRLASIYDVEKSEKIEWSVAHSVFSKLPKYSNLSNDPPLKWGESMRKAKNYCEKKNPNALIELDSASLKQPIAEEQRESIYFYLVTFKVTIKGQEPTKYDVLILPNGKILEPKIIELKK